MTSVTIDNTWLTTNGPAPYALSADNTKYNLTVDVNVVPVQPTATATLTNRVVTAIAPSGGSNFDPANPPTVTVTAPTKTQGAITAVLTSDAVTSGTITNAGAGYATAPTITFAAPPTGTRATGHVTLSAGGTIATVVIDVGGSGYVSAPAVTVGAPNATTATAHAVLNPLTGVVASIVVDNGGNTYGSTPTVTLSGGSVWLDTEVFVFPDVDKTGRNPKNIVLVTNGHLIQINGKTAPQKTDAFLYRRTSEYTARVDYTNTPHAFGGLYFNGSVTKPINDPNLSSQSFESPSLYNESTYSVTQ